MISVTSSAGFMRPNGQVLSPKAVTLILNFEGIGDASIGSMTVHLSLPQACELAGRLLGEAARVEQMEPEKWEREPQGGGR